MSDDKITCEFCRSVVATKYLQKHQDTAKKCREIQAKCEFGMRPHQSSDSSLSPLELKTAKQVFSGIVEHYRQKPHNPFDYLIRKLSDTYDAGLMLDENYVELSEKVQEAEKSYIQYVGMVLDHNVFVSETNPNPTEIKSSRDFSTAIIVVQKIISTIKDEVEDKINWIKSPAGLEDRKSKCRKIKPVKDTCDYPCSVRKSFFGKKSCDFL